MDNLESSLLELFPRSYSKEIRVPAITFLRFINRPFEIPFLSDVSETQSDGRIYYSFRNWLESQFVQRQLFFS